MSKIQNKKFISIRTRLFLQVGAVVFVAVLLILSLNNSLLPTIYAQNEKRTMVEVKNEINGFDFAADCTEELSALEKKHGFSIDVYSSGGEPIYFGTTDIFSSSGKITVSKRRDYDDGSFFEIQTIENENVQYIVYGSRLDSGEEIEMYSRKDDVDRTANIAVAITSVTSVVAMLAALGMIYYYSGKFTKPLIKMSEVTGKMADMDFSEKCEVTGNDELSVLSSSINHLSDSLNETLDDLHGKNEQLLKDIEKEKTLEKIRKDFISNVSHELKTPISIIRGYSEGASLMIENGEADSAKKYCDVIVGETEKMNALVLQLLELSMYESGNVALKEETFDISALTDDYFSANSIKMQEKGVAFKNEIPENTLVLGDSVKTEMIVNNYISNAVSHAEDKKQITVSSTDLGDRYRISVFNTGKPIADEDIDKIWIAFYRADKSRSRSEGRYGLGLSIVSAIQRLYGLDYGVKNLENGVEFWFDAKKSNRDSQNKISTELKTE